MSILSVAKDVAGVVGLEIPTALVTSTEREHVELFGVIEEMAERIFMAADWQRMMALGTFTGDGTTTSFERPGTYRRLVKEQELWSTRLQAPLSHVRDMNDWLSLEVQENDPAFGAWTLLGGEFVFKPAPAAGELIKFYFMRGTYVQPVSGALKEAFTLDTDRFVLSELQLKLGTIWQWKANKGLPYAEDMATYEENLARTIMNNRGPGTLHIGRQRPMLGATYAYPWPIVP
jgi:hypothetical protein